jgi:hypothetical protein
VKILRLYVVSNFEKCQQQGRQTSSVESKIGLKNVGWMFSVANPTPTGEAGTGRIQSRSAAVLGGTHCWHAGVPLRSDLMVFLVSPL